ncbi:TfuA-like protein [Streptomyces lushanensis]|uniref:TfuA-like protein n=1 Tax=Streptomyces lushanensis TaxID=1434255 RepID=UPI003CCC09E9
MRGPGRRARRACRSGRWWCGGRAGRGPFTTGRSSRAGRRWLHDEVAVGQSTDADLRSVNWPLANVRHALKLAAAAGFIGTERAADVLGGLQAVYYPHRSLTAVLAISRESGAGELARWLTTQLATDRYFGDLKRADALRAPNSQRRRPVARWQADGARPRPRPPGRSPPARAPGWPDRTPHGATHAPDRTENRQQLNTRADPVSTPDPRRAGSQTPATNRP